MTVIDAGSHFTTGVSVEKLPPLPDRALKLARGGHLCFGHWELGDRHNTFAVLLRAMKDMATAEILDDLRVGWQKSFGTANPDLVIFPGDSTAIHLAERFADKLGMGENAVIASPAFRAYGKHQLRLEISNPHLSRLGSKGRLDILFFDDSFSSGQTEEHVIDAFIREKRHLLKSPKIRWLTYTVLQRGQELRPGKQSFERKSPPLAEQEGFEYRFRSFVGIRPESVSHSSCPLCDASSRVRNAAIWGRAARPAVRDLLDRLSTMLEARPIERLASPLSTIDCEVGCNLLRLEGMPMPDACVYIFRHILSRKPEGNASEQMLAALLFVDLHYGDIGSYLAPEAVSELICRTAEKVNIEVVVHRDTLLLALSLLPVSVVEAVLEPLLSNLASRGAVDFSATLLAIVFSSQHHALLNAGSREAAEQRVQTLAKRRWNLVETVKRVGKDTSERAAVREMVRADLSTLASVPREGSPAWVARTLSALLHRGRHPSFLSEQIDKLKPSTVGSVRDGLLQALNLMRILPTAIVDHLQERIDSLAAQLRKCAEQDVNECRKLANEVVTDLWIRSIHKQFFVQPRVIDQELRRLTIEPVKAYSQTGIKTEHFFLLECDDSIMAWDALGPDFTILRSHFTNLLFNPIKHFPLERLIVAQGDSPVAVAYLRLDEVSERLQLVVADRSAAPNRQNLFGLRHGLANTRGYLQLFGGDLEYRRESAGFLKSSQAPAAKQSAEFLAKGWSGETYQNMFVTSFALMLKTT